MTVAETIFWSTIVSRVVSVKVSILTGVIGPELEGLMQRTWRVMGEIEAMLAKFSR